MSNNITIPRDQFDQYMAREEFYKENLTSFPMIFPIKDFGGGMNVINNYCDVTHIMLNTNSLNVQINEKLKDKFTNKFVFKVNPENICELQLLSINDNSSFKKVIANITFTSCHCIINLETENRIVRIKYEEKGIDKSYDSDNFWKRFIDIFINTL